MNVLITSAGRRVSLVKAFAEAVHQRDGLLVAADIDGLAPALYSADHAVRVPPVHDPDYISALLDCISEYEISLVVPTIDPELFVLAKCQERFKEKGSIALVSDYDFVFISGDKWLTVNEFHSRGFRVPKTWLPSKLGGSELPKSLFVKPRDGSASQYAYRASPENIPHLLALIPNPIVQEYIPGPELTVDALLDLCGHPIHYVIRRRIKTVGGESVEGVTLPPDPLHDYLVRLLGVIGELGGRGPITIQLFLDPGGPILSEINPRFGGGFPLAWAAGARYPEWILDMLEGKEVEPRLGQYKTGLYMTRYYAEIIRETPLWR